MTPRDLLARLRTPRVREIARYAVAGLITTGVNYGAFVLLTRVFSANEYLAEAIGWIISVIASYGMNRVYVFRSRDVSVTREFARFFASRMAAWGVDLGVFALCFSVIGLGDLPAKLIANAVVIVVNYGVSKWLVFKKG